MQVFKVFFKVLNKKKTALLIYIFTYLAITLVLSSVVTEKEEESFSSVSLAVAIENRDQGKLGDVLAAYLEGRHQRVEMPEGREELQDAMYYKTLDYVLAIPEDFTEQMVAGAGEGLLEGTAMPGSSRAYFMDHELGHYLQTVSMYLAAGYGVEEAGAKASAVMEQKPDVSFLEKTDTVALPAGYYFFRYIPYVFVILMILGVGAVMKTFQDKDLAGRNKCSATPFLSQNLQLLLGCMSYILAVYLVFMLFACVSDPGYMFSRKGALSAANALIFGLCALSVAWFSVQFVRNASELNIMSNVFGLGFSFLGGVFVPMELMGEKARILGKFVPSYWYVSANAAIQKMESLAETAPVYQAFGMVLVFTAAFLAAGLLLSRVKVKG